MIKKSVICWDELAMEAIKPSIVKGHLHTQHKEIHSIPQKLWKKWYGNKKLTVADIQYFQYKHNYSEGFNVAFQFPKKKNTIRNYWETSEQLYHQRVYLEMLLQAEHVTQFSNKTVTWHIRELPNDIRDQHIEKIEVAK